MNERHEPKRADTGIRIKRLTVDLRRIARRNGVTLVDVLLEAGVLSGADLADYVGRVYSARRDVA